MTCDLFCFHHVDARCGNFIFHVIKLCIFFFLFLPFFFFFPHVYVVIDKREEIEFIIILQIYAQICMYSPIWSVNLRLLGSFLFSSIFMLFFFSFFNKRPRIVKESIVEKKRRRKKNTIRGENFHCARRIMIFVVRILAGTLCTDIEKFYFHYPDCFDIWKSGE